MRIIILICWFLGLALFLGLILRAGIGSVMIAIAGAGWGALAVTAFHVVPMSADALGWRILHRGVDRPARGLSLRMRWVLESVNGLLPVAQLGGELARVRMAAVHGMPGTLAGATTTVDVTLGALSQAVFAAAGIAVLMLLAPADREQVEAWIALIIGLAVFGLLVGAFALLQNMGLFGRLVALFAGLVRQSSWSGLVGRAESLDAAIRTVYRQSGLLPAFAWRLAGWVLGTGEVWLALYFLGYPVGLLEAFMLESLTQAVRSAGFLVPAGLGLQEGAFMLLGASIGLGPEVGLAASLMRRIRELGLGIPGLVAWQLSEGRRFLAKRAVD